MFDANLIREAILDAEAQRRSMGPILENHVVICKTIRQGKEYMTDHKCSKCWQKVRYYSTSNSLRGMTFKDVKAIHVLHYDPELWRDLGIILQFSKFNGPIWTKMSL